MVEHLAKLLVRVTPKRRWAQFSLGSLLLVVTALSVPLAIVVNRTHQRQQAVAAIRALGGYIDYAGFGEAVPESFVKKLLRRWLARDYFDEVRGVDLRPYRRGRQRTGPASIAEWIGGA